MNNATQKTIIQINDKLEYETTFITQHIFIVGTTGSGKTRAIQKISEELLSQNIGIYLSDIKGDLGGLYANCEVLENKDKKALIFKKKDFPIQFPVAKIPVPILSKLFELNPTQEEALYIIIEYAKKRRTKTLEQLIQLINKQNYESIDKKTKQVILRKLNVAKIKRYGKLFGSKPLDLTKKLNIGVFGKIRTDPHLISTINILILNEIFHHFGECGSCVRYVAIFDEAHYLFRDANPSLIKLVETILRQIRSKGVGIIFASQDTTDIPKRILKLFSSRFVFRTNIYSDKDRSDLKLLVGKDYEIVRNFKPGECYYSFPSENKSKTGTTKWDLPKTKNGKYEIKTINKVKNFISKLFG